MGARRCVGFRIRLLCRRHTIPKDSRTVSACRRPYRQSAQAVASVVFLPPTRLPSPFVGDNMFAPDRWRSRDLRQAPRSRTPLRTRLAGRIMRTILIAFLRRHVRLPLQRHHRPRDPQRGRLGRTLARRPPGEPRRRNGMRTLRELRLQHDGRAVRRSRRCRRRRRLKHFFTGFGANRSAHVRARDSAPRPATIPCPDGRLALACPRERPARPCPGGDDAG